MAAGQAAGGLGPEGLREALGALPSAPGVYLFLGERGLLYVGKSVNLRERVRSYFHAKGGHNRHTERLRFEAQRVIAHVTASELEALLVESALIKVGQPRYNVRGRRFEHYPFLKLTAETYPRLIVTRRLEEDGARYFGPFGSARRLEELVEVLSPLFGLRDCGALGDRSCLKKDLGRCLAPCVLRVAEPYRAAVAELEALLHGEVGPALEQLERAMKDASERCDFERAAHLRDRRISLLDWVSALARQDELRTAERLLVSESAGMIALTALRRARWAGQWIWPRDRLAAAAPSLIDWLHGTFVAEPPSRAISEREVDEVQIIGSFLYRHRRDPAVWVVPLDDLPGVADRALAWAGGVRESVSSAGS